MKRRRKKYKILIMLIFTTIMTLISVSYAILNNKINIIGKATLSPKQEEIKGYNVTYIIRDRWNIDNKYIFQISMTLENNTEEILDEWKISIEKPENGEILNYYNVNCRVTDNTIEFSNLPYNAQIPSKEKFTFEFQISTTNPYYKPGNIIVNGIPNPKPEEPNKPEEKKVEIMIEKENQWGTEGEYYTQIKVIIKNTGKTEINSWQFDVNFENETTIDQMWNVKAEKISEKQYRISNSDYNGMIQPDSEIILGGIIKTSNIENKFEITNIVCK